MRAPYCAHSTRHGGGGRYRYTRLPFGIKTAWDIFIHETNKLFGDLKGVGIVTDDMLVYVNTIEEHNNRLKAILDMERDIQ